MKAFVVLSVVLLCVITGGDSWKTKTVRTGYGIQFPRRPITKTAMQRYIFDKDIYVIYWLNNPLFNETFARDIHAVWTENPYSGGFDYHWTSRNDGQCTTGIFTYENIPEEGNRALYYWNGTFPTTGAPITMSVFTSNPQDYVFYFLCLDRSTEVLRRGRRLFCGGPYEIAFATYTYPPNRIKSWCAAESDLWTNTGKHFDDEFMRFNPDGNPCPA